MLFLVSAHARASDCPPEGETRSISGTVKNWFEGDKSWEIVPTDPIALAPLCRASLITGALPMPETCRRKGATVTTEGRVEFTEQSMMDGGMALVADTVSCE